MAKKSRFVEELELKVTPSPDQVPPEALEELDEDDVLELGAPEADVVPAVARRQVQIHFERDADGRITGARVDR